MTNAKFGFLKKFCLIAAVSTFGTLIFVSSMAQANEAQLRALINRLSGRVTSLQHEVYARRLPVGTLVFLQNRCNKRYLKDVTDQFNGRLLFADASVESTPTLVEGDGSHTHTGGAHTHKVTGRTSQLGVGERKGTLDRDTTAPHQSTSLTVTGTAAEEINADGSLGHTHTGGAHTHKSFGVRVCLVVQ